MKSLMRDIVAGMLAILARGVIRKYRPKIVMITGSVGKTSTKDAVAAALSGAFDLRASEKSYNSEFGVPFTIFGVRNPWSSPVAWLSVVATALGLMFIRKPYPHMLVLEVGADRPGDLAKILRIATPDAVVVTHLPEVPVHVEAYASPQAVRDEEFTPAYALAPGAPLILSADDEHAREMAKELSAAVATFGFSPEADVHLSEPEPYQKDGKTVGVKATVTVNGMREELKVVGALGRPQLYAPAAALTLARALGIAVPDALRSLASYTPPPGRARILAGRNGAVLIDDSYNASPAAVVESLAALRLMPEVSRRIAVLGDMLELGRYSAEEHERVGRIAARAVEVLVTVGSRARAIAKAAREAGMAETAIMEFATSPEAGEALAGLVRQGDLVLIKGSQSVRTERVVERLLADPHDRDKLVRQEREWQLIK